MIATPTYENMIDEQLAQEQRNQYGRLAGDERLLVAFYQKPVRNEVRSQEEGRPIFDANDYVRIFIPGDQHTVLDAIATDEYKTRFPREWEMFQRKSQDQVSGTPLEALKGLSVAQIAEFKSLHIHTVEALAELPDSLGQKIPGINALKKRAETFLVAAREESVALRAKETTEKLTDQQNLIAQQQAQIDALKEQLGAFMNASKTKKRAVAEE